MLQEVVTVTPVVVSTSAEQADVTPLTGMMLLIGIGTLGSAGKRLVTVDSVPPLFRVVVRLRVVTPVQVAAPVTVTAVALIAVVVCAVHVSVGAAVADPAAKAPRPATNNTTVNDRPIVRIISVTSARNRR